MIGKLKLLFLPLKAVKWKIWGAVAVVAMGAFVATYWQGYRDGKAYVTLAVEKGRGDLLGRAVTATGREREKDLVRRKTHRKLVQEATNEQSCSSTLSPCIRSYLERLRAAEK